MEIKLLSGSANYYKEATNINVIAFGKIKQGGEAKATLKIEGADSSTLLSTCGCSVASKEETNVFTIQYNDTNIISPFSKVFILNYREGNKNLQSQIKITGNVIK